jgi:hypothetical protein
VISATSLGSTQWTRESTSGDPKRVLRGGGTLRGELLVRHPRPNAAGVDELAVIREVAKQERAKVWPRSFRVGPADDDELLAAQRFGFAPQAARFCGV